MPTLDALPLNEALRTLERRHHSHADERQWDTRARALLTLLLAIRTWPGEALGMVVDDATNLGFLLEAANAEGSRRDCLHPLFRQYLADIPGLVWDDSSARWTLLDPVDEAIRQHDYRVIQAGLDRV